MSEIKTMRLLLQVLRPLQYLALVVMKMLLLVSGQKRPFRLTLETPLYLAFSAIVERCEGA